MAITLKRTSPKDSLHHQKPLREFVKDLQPNSKILSRPTPRSRIEATKEMKVTEASRGVDHITITTN